MNSARELPPFDFRRGSGLPVHSELCLRSWEQNLCNIAPENWGQYLQGEPKMAPAGRKLLGMLEARQQFAEASLAYRCMLGEDGPTTLFVFPRPLMLALISSVLGESLDELPEDRELTAVERSLCDHLLEELTRALGEAWPDQVALECRLLGAEPKPQRTRLFPLTEKMLLSQFAVSDRFGTQEFSWVLPRQAIEEFIQVHGSEPQRNPSTSQHLPEAVARGLPAELVVRLGQASLDVAELANLRVGDVVILDQRITDPLIADVSGSPKFLVRPGKSGARRACQIEALAGTADARKSSV
jgi:flagellar motor switch protein FliM